MRVNTVLCGTDRHARKSFEDIARAASGEFTMISLFGSAHAPASPLDGEIHELSTDLRARRARGMTSRDAQAKALTERVRKLVRERDAQVGAQGGFDERVTETIRKQARNFGIAY